MTNFNEKLNCHYMSSDNFFTKSTFDNFVYLHKIIEIRMRFMI